MNFLRNNTFYKSTFFVMVASVVLLFMFSANSFGGALLPIDPFMKGESVKNLPPLETLDGKKIDFAKISKDKVVILAFWLHTCGQCTESIKQIDAFLDKNGRRDKAVILSVTRGSSKIEKQLIKKEVAKWNSKILVAMDPDMNITRAFTAYQAPAFVAIGRDGKVKTNVITYPDENIRDYNFMGMIDLLIKKKEIPEIQFIPYTRVEHFKKMIGTAPPSFSLKDMDGKSFSIEQFKNKKSVVLVFWHPYNTTCKTEMELIAKYYEETSKKYNYELLSVASIYGYSQQDDIRSFQKESKAKFVFLSDENSVVGNQYVIEKIPTVFFIDKNGKIFDVMEGESKNIDQRFSPLLKEMNNTPPKK